MSTLPLMTGVDIDNFFFSPAAKPPASTKTFFLGGAGVRGLEIEGKFKKFTAIGVYLEDTAVPFLAGKWKGKSVEELTDSVDFFRDIVTGQISFSKDTSIPEVGSAKIKSRDLSETVLETIIGKNGVSPAAKRSLAAKLSELMKNYII
ncbi:hypothetical protein EZV62_025525 [Acer yangbiense]|uniref:Chalcone-flavonone isomerase family protein n=1 Tax=Acer yangbiense TaxID=1000413 RepID=A0A5C7GY44_9ROSI|nr:hypothetical protein EZV62_025525 [Acer yangbiense]